MINTQDVLETIGMIREENLDIRTITMGISLWDCVSEDTDRLCEKIYDKITTKAKNLVKTGEEIEKMYGIPIVNKRVSVTPVSLIGGTCSPEGYIKIARTLQRAADEVGIVSNTPITTAITSPIKKGVAFVATAINTPS